MDNTILNIVGFILITILYYLALKPKLTLDILLDPTMDLYKNYNKSMYFRLGIYFLLILLVQFGINSSAIINKCGGSVSQNIGVAGLMTFLPWVLIFGLVIIILIVFPGFKSAFSDVIGYFYVSNQANKALTDILMDTNIYDKIDKVQDAAMVQPLPLSSAQPLEDQNQNQNKNQNLIQDTDKNENTNKIQQGGIANKKDLQDAADAIIKLCGNMSILINQIVPSNFLQYMEMLKPLMKPKYESDPALLKLKEQALLDVVIIRDNIGEAFWYIYTGILLISIVQYNIASKPCVQDPATMQANYKKFLNEQEITNKEKALGQGVYTIKN
jgi:hypothetical protein